MRLVHLGAMVCVWLTTHPSAAAQDIQVDPQQEYNVKGAFLYSFGRYVTWPQHRFADEKSPFVIGVLGDPPMDQILDRIRKTKTVHGRPIEVRRFRSPAEYEPCHIFFIARGVESDALRALLHQLRDAEVLLVGEAPGFARWGVVNFYLEADSVRFEINVDSARRRNLQIDPKLLSVARLVRDSSDQ